MHKFHLAEMPENIASSRIQQSSDAYQRT